MDTYYVYKQPEVNSTYYKTNYGHRDRKVSDAFGMKVNKFLMKENTFYDNSLNKISRINNDCSIDNKTVDRSIRILDTPDIIDSK